MPIHDWSRVEVGIFHDFRLSWVVEISRSLNGGVLPSDYYALIEPFASGLGLDVLSVPATKVGGDVDEMELYRRRQNAIAVRRASDDRIVAAVQVVSPANKSSRHAMRRLVQRASELLERRVHLLILDPIALGPDDPCGTHGAIWDDIEGRPYSPPSEKPLTMASYESGPLRRAYVEPVAVGDVLPDMPLFLEPDGCVEVPLEASYQLAWEAVPRRWKSVIESPR